MSLINSILLDANTVQTVVENASGDEKISALSLALQGGWVMIVLVLLLILALYIFFERFFTLGHALKDDSSSFMEEIRKYVHSGNVEGAQKLAKSTDTSLGRMVAKGLSRLGRPLSDIQTAVENEGKMEVTKLEKNVWLVATVASVGPMLGFLGTVTGMVTAFQGMADAGNNLEISTLAEGIYQAMVTTIGGLIVGIIAYFCYNILVARINKVVETLETRSMEFMDLLHEPA